MLREALASAFLQHAVPKGLNFAFVELLRWIRDDGNVWGFCLGFMMAKILIFCWYYPYNLPCIKHAVFGKLAGECSYNRLRIVVTVIQNK